MGRSKREWEREGGARRSADEEEVDGEEGVGVEGGSGKEVCVR